MARIAYPERIALARLPTPLECLGGGRWDGFLPEGMTLWIKRDDLSGFGLSGNKVRKLEFVLAKALAEGADTVITCGGLQSNHARATALACAQLGLSCELILRGEPEGIPDGNLFIDHFCGAHVHALPVREYRTAFDQHLQQLLDALRAQGKKPYFIPTGASDGVGIWGYVRASEELLADCEAAGFVPDAIVHATGSGGTQAGLLAGLALQGRDIPVFGVNVCDDRAYFEHKIAADLADWRERYSPPVMPGPESIRIIEGYMAPGYGKTTETLRDVMRQAARRGLLLDPVYSGKAFQGLLQEAQNGCLAGMKHIVFVHTGGFFGALDMRAELLAGQ